MKTKQLIIALIITIFLLVSLFYLRMKEEEHYDSPEKKIGIVIFKDLPVNEVSELKIKKGNSPEVVIKKKENVWNVSSLFSYPADFDKVRQFINDIAEMKNIQNIKVGESNYSRLGVDSTGTTVSLFDSSGKELASMIIGKEHIKKGNSAEDIGMEWPDGKFILIPKTKNAFVVSQHLSNADNPSKDWVDRDFISAKDIKTASLTESGTKKWQLSRKNENGKLEPEKPAPDGKELDSNKINSIQNCLHTIRFADIADPLIAPAESGLDNHAIFRAETFSGKNYELKIGKQKDGLRYVKLDISFVAPQEAHSEETTVSESEKNETKAKEELEKKKQEHAEKIKKAEEEAKNEQKKFGSWIYLIADYNINPMLTKEEELYKNIESKEDKKESDKKEETQTIHIDENLNP